MTLHSPDPLPGREYDDFNGSTTTPLCIPAVGLDRSPTTPPTPEQGTHDASSVAELTTQRHNPGRVQKR